MKLKTHTKEFNEYTQIDKFALVPKKMWGDIKVGSQRMSINGHDVTARIYDIPCDCSGVMHSHRLMDLRGIWDKLGLKQNEDIEVSGCDSRISPKIKSLKS